LMFTNILFVVYLIRYFINRIKHLGPSGCFRGLLTYLASRGSDAEWQVSDTYPLSGTIRFPSGADSLPVAHS